MLIKIPAVQAEMFGEKSVKDINTSTVSGEGRGSSEVKRNITRYRIPRKKLLVEKTVQKFRSDWLAGTGSTSYLSETES